MKKRLIKKKVNFVALLILIICLVMSLAIVFWKSIRNLNPPRQPSPLPLPLITATHAPRSSMFISSPIAATLPAPKLPRPASTTKPVSWQSYTIPENELIQAINVYRQAHGLSILKTNEGLCQEARARAQEIYNQNVGRFPPFLLGHEGFFRDIQNETISRLSGLNFFGENVASANCKRISDGGDVYVENATQLVEWCFDASEGHRENLLRVDWTDICSSGHYPFYVQIFGK